MELGRPVGEVNQFRRDYYEILAAETDPAAIAAYVNEFGRSEDVEAVGVVQEHGQLLVNGLSAILQKRQAASMSEAAPKQEVVDTEHDEPEVIVLTQEEVTKQKFQVLYQKTYAAYKKECAAIPAIKRSKQEHRLKMAKRKCVKQLCDLSNITGSEHIIQETDLLNWALAEEIDPDLYPEIKKSATEYAKAHGLTLSQDKRNFANIIASSVKGRPGSDLYMDTLKAIVSASNTSDAYDILRNLANACFYLTTDTEAAGQATRIWYGLDNLVSPRFQRAYNESLAKIVTRDMANGNWDSYLDDAVIANIFRQINVFSGLLSDQEANAIQDIYDNQFGEIAADQVKSEEHTEAVNILKNTNRIITEAKNWIGDPIIITNIDKPGFDIGATKGFNIPDTVEVYMGHSELYKHYMQQFAPDVYSRQITGIIFGEGVGISRRGGAISPDLFIEVAVPLASGQILENSNFTQAHIYEACKKYIEQEGLKVKPYKLGGKLELSYLLRKLDANVTSVAIIRPLLERDKPHIDPISYLNLNLTQLLSKNIITENSYEDYVKENELLRQEIISNYRRDLGRRPVKFPSPQELQFTGLTSIAIRKDPDYNCYKVAFTINDDSFEVPMDYQFHIASPYANNAGSLFYENIILKLAKQWMCSREIRTSEGIVNEEAGATTNFGHYAYLRVVDGKKWTFSQKQSEIQAQEQGHFGFTLAQKSEMLKLQDETGQQRNSTYVREKYDPSAPPLEVYGTKIEIRSSS